MGTEEKDAKNILPSIRLLTFGDASSEVNDMALHLGGKAAQLIDFD